MRRATAMKTCPLLDFKRTQLAMRKKAQHTLKEKRKENTEYKVRIAERVNRKWRDVFSACPDYVWVVTIISPK